uniref:Uncharacterized protein n=1 Tax=Hyaloperonospora arabidopsidis (strain Emoy2) TaxID=559515 RepID=M4B8C1_HYAAE
MTVTSLFLVRLWYSTNLRVQSRALPPRNFLLFNELVGASPAMIGYYLLRHNDTRSVRRAVFAGRFVLESNLGERRWNN